MAKKAKKAKENNGGKSGKNGKKGKKEGKEKVDKEDILKQTLANMCIIETRLQASETKKSEYRRKTRTLLDENNNLQSKIATTEKDTIDVVSFLKREDVQKDLQISKLQLMFKDLKKEYKKEKQTLVNEYTAEIEKMQNALNEQNEEMKIMKAELNLVKEFRKKRVQLENELNEIKDEVHRNGKDHDKSLETLERKFIEEKIRLQQEAGQKISELAERAHTEAVNNLNDATRSIYRENIRLNESLNYHIKLANSLSEKEQELLAKNQKLNDEEDMNSMIVEEKLAQAKTLAKIAKELKGKVTSLESKLGQVTKESQSEKVQLKQQYADQQKENQATIARLRRTLQLKNKEMVRVKQLAQNIVDKRSEVEQFLMESLEYVKEEIVKNRTQYRRDAEIAYNRRMRQSYAGEAEYPRIRTFRSACATSTNSVYTDLQQAEKWVGLEEVVDIADLTWEQREKVLRLVFAKMNGFKNKCDKQKSSSRAILPPINAISDKMEELRIKNGTSNEPIQNAFITDISTN